MQNWLRFGAAALLDKRLPRWINGQGTTYKHMVRAFNYLTIRVATVSEPTAGCTAILRLMTETCDGAAPNAGKTPSETVRILGKLLAKVVRQAQGAPDAPLAAVDAQVRAGLRTNRSFGRVMRRCPRRTTLNREARRIQLAATHAAHGSL